MNEKELLDYLCKEFQTRIEKASKKVGSHGIAHSLRVLQYSKKISVGMKVDWKILLPAIIFHDLGVSFSKTMEHEEISIKEASDALNKIGYPKEKIDAVARAIKVHDQNEAERESPEAKILFDADNLDAFGAIGAWRYIRVFEERGYSLGQTCEHALKNVEERYKNLHTAKAKELGRETHLFTKNFFKRMKKELEEQD